MTIRLLLLSCLAATPALADPLAVTTRVLVEQRRLAADGTTGIALVAPARLVPGDRVQVVLAYRNTGRAPVSDLVLANPVPAGMAYRGAVAGSPAPEVSVDGAGFAPLAGLTLRGADGRTRPAAADDVTQVRWRLSRPLASGGHGQFAFSAVIR